MFKKRKSEEDIRYDKRVSKLLVDIQHAFDWLMEHTRGIVYIVVSKDDYGNNLQEDWSISIRAEDILNRVNAANPYHIWTFTEHVVTFTDTKGKDRKINIDKDIRCIHVPHSSSDVKIGEISNSGNIRTGEIFVMGIMLNSYLSELTSPPTFTAN